MKLLLTLIISLFVNTNVLECQTIWTGTKTTFSKNNYSNWKLESNQDRITSNVWITRDDKLGIFNIAKETVYTKPQSPVDTEWSFGTTSNIASLTFTNWREAIGNNPPAMVNKNMVLHLINDDIYIDIKFTKWVDGGNGGGFAYIRSTDDSQSDKQAIIEVDRDTIAYGKVLLGECIDEEIIIQNDGDADLKILDLIMAGTSKTQFSVPNYFNNIIIEVGKSFKIPISYCPTIEGQHKAVLIIKSNSENNKEYNIVLSGIGEQAMVELPLIKIDKDAIDYGKVETKDAYNETINISNIGDADLQILDLYITGSDKTDFSVRLAMGKTIKPGKSKEMNITYNPTTEGEHNAVLTIKSNSDSSSELNISLTGIFKKAEVKLPSISSDITNIDFGEAELEQYLADTITISNTGKAKLYISEFNITGEGNDNFAVQTSPKDSLESGEKDEVIITYCPSEEGTHSAVLTIISNAENNKELVINLTGIGKDVSSINDNNISNILSVSVSPNPITSTSLINYSINSNTSVNIELFIIDILGNKVLELKNELISNGSYSYELNSNNLSSGKYYLIGKINNNISKLPIIIQK